MALQSTVATVNKPNFISIGFCLRMLVELGGSATGTQLRQHARERYGLTESDLRVLGIRLRSLQKQRFIELRQLTRYTNNFCYYIVEEAKPYVHKVMNQE